MSDKIKKVTITIQFDGTAEDEEILRSNARLAKSAVAIAATLGLFKKLPEILLFPVGLFDVADIEVIRIEPNQQTQSK